MSIFPDFIIALQKLTEKNRNNAEFICYCEKKYVPFTSRCYGFSDFIYINLR